MVHAPLFHVRLMSILLLSAYSSKTCKRLLRSETINSIHRLGFTNVLYSPVAPVYVHPKTSIPNQYNDGYKRVTCFSKISHTVNSVSRSVTTNVLYPPGAPAYVRSKTSILNQYIAACNVHSQTPNSDRFSNNQDTTKSNIKASEINNDGIYSAFAECIVTIKDAVKTFLKKLGVISKKPYPDDTADVATFGAKKEDIRHKTFKSSNRLSDDNNMTISKIEAYTILDSRGFPTVAVDLTINNGLVFHAAVPSGASTGKYEALELRDNDQCYFLGKGVNAAINNIENIIAPALIKSGLKVTEQRAIDDLMIKLDGTPNKCKLGANAILGVSIAVANAGAYQEIIPLYKHIANLAGNKQIALPVPAFNVINGGSHAGNKLAMQEFMILPTGANSFSEAMRMGSEVYHNLKNVIKAKYGLDATLVGDEGGFAPNILDSKECLRLIESGIKNAGYMGKVKIGMDVAASEFYIDGKYDLDFKNKSDSKDKSQIISTEALTNFYIEIIKEFPIVSIEDPFDQDHWEAWTNFTASTDIQIVGDDLTVTNPIRITKAISKKACNCLLLKINQIGTVTESIDAHLLAKKNGWSTMVSHRSGETEDTFIADLVVGLGAKEIKAGAPCRSERNAKYNRLVRIERELEEEKKRKDTNDDCS